MESDETLDDPQVFCARLLACKNVQYDPNDSDAGYTLERVLVHVRPTTTGFPLKTDRLFLFAQLFGTPGEYTIRVRYGRVLVDDEGDVVVEELNDYGPWDIELPGVNYVECYGIPLVDVSYPEPGIYEFQLWVDGQEDMMMSERIEARE